MGYDVEINPKMIRVLYRRLIIAGYSPVEASNLIAKLMGLAVTENGWKVKELQRLLFEEWYDKREQEKVSTRP